MVAAVPLWADLAIPAGEAVTLLVMGAGAIIKMSKWLKPLRSWNGIPAEESPDGEAIPSIPAQLFALRSGQKTSDQLISLLVQDVADVKQTVEARTAQLAPNGGSSLYDSVRRTEQAAAHIDRKLEAHLAESRKQLGEKAQREAELDEKIETIVREQDRQARALRLIAVAHREDRRRNVRTTAQRVTDKILDDVGLPEPDHDDHDA